MENKYEMEISFNDNFKNEDGNIVEVLYTTIPDLTDIQYCLEELQEIEMFDMNDITKIIIDPLNKFHLGLLWSVSLFMINFSIRKHIVPTIVSIVIISSINIVFSFKLLYYYEL